MQKETIIQGMLMCLSYLGHLCLDLMWQYYSVVHYTTLRDLSMSVLHYTTLHYMNTRLNPPSHQIYKLQSKEYT